MEEALPPFSIAGCGGWMVTRRERTLVECVDIGDVEDHASPPAPTPLCRLGDEIEIAAPGSEAGEGRSFAAVHEVEPLSRICANLAMVALGEARVGSRATTPVTGQARGCPGSLRSRDLIHGGAGV